MSENKRKTRPARPDGKGKASGDRFSKVKKFLASPAVTMSLFVLAIVMLLGSTVGGASAVLTYESASYRSRVQMFNIGVSLFEQCGDNAPKKVSWRDYDTEEKDYWDEGTIADKIKSAKGDSLLTDLLPEGEELKLGKKYKERLYVQNTGDIDQYVRVTIYKYWMSAPLLDAEGKEQLDDKGQVVREKLPELAPSLIDLNLVNYRLNNEAQSDDSQRWILDTASSTKERTVLYYRDILKAPGEGVPEAETRTLDLTDYLMIDSSVADKVTQTTDTRTENGKTYTTITTTYIYDGVEFRIEAQVDAVQTHSAKDAIWSAWGREVEIDSNGSLISVK